MPISVFKDFTGVQIVHQEFPIVNTSFMSAFYLVLIMNFGQYTCFGHYSTALKNTDTILWEIVSQKSNERTLVYRCNLYFIHLGPVSFFVFIFRKN